jgi:antitoxin ParD1/3/4
MNMNVSLTDELGEFVNAKVSSGRYTSASEVVREALRLMERYEEVEAAKLQWLREAYQVGIASGDAGELDIAALKAEARSKLGKRAK